MSRSANFITEARQATKAIWDNLNKLKALQTEWNALDYGNTLEDGSGENAGILADDVGAVVFATSDAFTTLLGQGHATNMGKLLY